MDLEPMLDRLARTLSGGMLRRLEIATRAAQPPGGAVPRRADRRASTRPRARMVWEHLQALREQAGTTILVTTHLMEEAERHCDRLGDHRPRPARRAGRARRAARAPRQRRASKRCSRAVTGRPIADRRGRRGREARRCPRPAPRRPPARLSAPAARSRRGPLARLAEGTLAMAQAEMRKLRHDHLDIVTRSVQPLLWLFIFGTALRHNTRARRGGTSTTAPTSRPA